MSIRKRLLLMILVCCGVELTTSTCGMHIPTATKQPDVKVADLPAAIPFRPKIPEENPINPNESLWDQKFGAGERSLFDGDYAAAQSHFMDALQASFKSESSNKVKIVQLKFTFLKLTESFLLDNNLKPAEKTYLELRKFFGTGNRNDILNFIIGADMTKLMC